MVWTPGVEVLCWFFGCLGFRVGGFGGFSLVVWGCIPFTALGLGIGSGVYIGVLCPKGAMYDPYF